jgi:hypothetical protein
MTKKIIFLTIYIFAVALFTFYYGNNFSDFVHRKGEESSYYLYFLIATNILFNFLVWPVSVRNLFWMLLTPVANIVTSFIITLIVMSAFDIGGTPRQLILTYGCVYLLTMTALTIVWRGGKKKA